MGEKGPFILLLHSVKRLHNLAFLEFELAGFEATYLSLIQRHIQAWMAWSLPSLKINLHKL